MATSLHAPSVLPLHNVQRWPAHPICAARNVSPRAWPKPAERRVARVHEAAIAHSTPPVPSESRSRSYAATRTNSTASSPGCAPRSPRAAVQCRQQAAGVEGTAK
ncbi:hypothetical protein CERSUDRAFT_101463 [Gelatoporia subvermispora B]|uniref:Uncharacterized protein n=1 Tax=Ceriporiopsis subvermispora (strain B) TaxID=914234 RepID=M2Q0J1_CERS8|nr:hypothetical protein CERSUDRAFT_101463 [Gelatoporia subvermispora B]